MADHDPHTGMHSESGALAGEHIGRADNPVIKVQDLAWLEFEKPDLRKAEFFARAFGFSTALRTPNELHLRGSEAGPPCVLIRRGRRSRFVGPAFLTSEASDLLRLAEAADAKVVRMPENIGGNAVILVDPNGLRVKVVSGTLEHSELPAQQPQIWNVGDEVHRVNQTQRPLREPSRIQRLGHVVLQSTKYRASLDWYLHHLGMIVSDFIYYPGQRERGPVMSFIRCDLGNVPADHHTLALLLGPTNRYVHSAYQVTDMDALAAGGQYLLEQGYRRTWGIGRHVQGSQIFDYWRDPDGFMVEHFSDGDMFDNSLEPGWAPMSATGLAQWGPRPTLDFLGLDFRGESLRELRGMVGALREDNEFDIDSLRGLLKVANS